MRVASAWPQLGQPRSVRLHYVRGTALGQGALLPAGGNADPHDGMGVGGPLVGSSAPCFFSRAAAVAGSVLGNRSHDLVFGASLVGLCVRNRVRHTRSTLRQERSALSCVLDQFPCAKQVCHSVSLQIVSFFVVCGNTHFHFVVPTMSPSSRVF